MLTCTLNKRSVKYTYIIFIVHNRYRTPWPHCECESQTGKCNSVFTTLTMYTVTGGRLEGEN